MKSAPSRSTAAATVTLSDSSKNFIVSDGVNGLLTNVDNTISGAGTIGDTADTLFTLINEQGGTIDATGSECAHHRQRQPGRQ